jgi:hypothetical protein
VTEDDDCGDGFWKLGDRMVRWLSPQGLLATGTDVVLASLFGRFADKREFEGSIKMGKRPPPSFDEGTKYDTEDFWIDYVADTGDGWRSTYGVAWALCRPHTVIVDRKETEIVPGRILLMGGDEVYPSADFARYGRRLVKPYTIAARQLPDDGARRDVLAIPGNHDWYDGLTSFMRIFGREQVFARWRAPQLRSYYAAQLPHRWWVLGIDIAFDSYLDAAQLNYFRGLRGTEEHHIREHDRILLCTAKPTWSERHLVGDTRIATHARSTLLEDLAEEIVDDWECELPVVLSGDLHHYSRYETDGGKRQRITAGGGGAFLFPTHGLASTVSWREGQQDTGTLTLADSAYPSSDDSRALRKRILLAPFVNPSFIVMLGAIALILASQTRGGIETGSQKSIIQSLVDVEWGTILGKLFTRPLSGLIAIVLLIVLFVYADAKGFLTRCLMALPHWLAHVLVIVTSMWGALALMTAWFHLNAHTEPSTLRQIFAYAAAAFMVGAFGAVGGGLVFGLYLFSAERTGHHANDAYAALHLTSYKNFLRMRLAPDGSLWIYPMGIDRVPNWIPRVTDDTGGVMDPPGPPVVHLIEAPIRVVPQIAPEPAPPIATN